MSDTGKGRPVLPYRPRVLSPLVHSLQQIELRQGKLTELTEHFAGALDRLLAEMADDIASLRLAVLDLSPLARLITLTQRQPVKLTEDVQKALRAQFRAVRVTMGLPQALLAKEAGVSPMTVRNFESGRHKPSRITLRKFAGALLRHATAFGLQPALLDELRTAVDLLAPETDRPEPDLSGPIDQ